LNLAEDPDIKWISIYDELTADSDEILILVGEFSDGSADEEKRWVQTSRDLSTCYQICWHDTSLDHIKVTPPSGEQQCSSCGVVWCYDCNRCGTDVAMKSEVKFQADYWKCKSCSEYYCSCRRSPKISPEELACCTLCGSRYHHTCHFSNQGYEFLWVAYEADKLKWICSCCMPICMPLCVEEKTENHLARCSMCAKKYHICCFGIQYGTLWSDYLDDQFNWKCNDCKVEEEESPRKKPRSKPQTG
jgi:hypothetical protein